MDKWGFEIKRNQERISWFKLLLEPTLYAATHSMPIRKRSVRPTPQLETKRPVDLVADYLSCLRKHTLECLKRKYGRAFLEATPIDYILTVPAVSIFSSHFSVGVADLVLKMWSDGAKSSTLQAAEAAGFGSQSEIQLVSEPDAAAAWTLIREVQQHGLKVRDNEYLACGLC